jgi:transposase-like protein
MNELVRLQEDSGLTVREFCSNEGLNPSTFYYWIKKFKKQQSGNKDFIPLIVKPSRIGIKETGFSQMDASLDNKIELVYPNGTILRVSGNYDLHQLQALIHLYK